MTPLQSTTLPIDKFLKCTRTHANNLCQYSESPIVLFSPIAYRIIPQGIPLPRTNDTPKQVAISKK